jgi:hypothetical protein
VRIDDVAVGVRSVEVRISKRKARVPQPKLGLRSGLVEHVFRLLERRRQQPPRWLLENVPFMLSLDGGAAMRRLTDGLEELGSSWAYRVVDTRLPPSGQAPIHAPTRVVAVSASFEWR